MAAVCCKTLTSTFLNYNGSSLITSKSPRKLSIRATTEYYEEEVLERPKWSGETPLSRLVGALISFKPPYSVMKFGARQALISTAEKTNIPWREMTKEVLESEVYKELENVQNPLITYPDYYLNPFHAYDEGNLSWLGLDLSPYFLAVAKYKENNGAREKNINWVHANGEDTNLPSNSFDLVSIAYVLHECPARATVHLVKEAFRLLRPVGTIAITDNSPKSKILQIPPRKSAASYRADEWDVNKWAWEGILKVVSKGEECIIRLEDKSTGELYARAFLREGELHPVEPVVDSSRYFVLRIEDNIEGRLRHAFIGVGFRERTEAYDFQAALHDHMKYLGKKKTAEEMEQQYQNSSAVDYSLKDGETLILQLKNKPSGNIKTKPIEQGLTNISLTEKSKPNDLLLSIRPPPPPPPTLSPTSPRTPTSPNFSPFKSVEENIDDPRKEKPKTDPSPKENPSSEVVDDDFGDFQAAG